MNNDIKTKIIKNYKFNEIKNMRNVKIAITVILGLVVIGILVLYFSDKKFMQEVTTFQECEEQGYPVAESYPRQCRTPDGRMFVEELSNIDIKKDLIVVESLKSNEQISSPLVVTGKARGYWFFEGSFPIELLDLNGNILASGIAQAQSEWMTEEFVPFLATLDFDSGSIEKGTLVLKKDNPSGLLENDDKLEIPIMFEIEPISSGDCRPTGCNLEVCSDESVITLCESKPEYACYPLAVCERQSSGACGWTETLKYKSCIVDLNL